MPKVIPKVVIVTRTKDRPTFLTRALESVSRQTYVDYIHVIVNDGGNKEIINSLVNGLHADQRQKTKVFHRSLSSNAPDTIFNESIDYIDSEYFAIHDDDDTWHPNFLSETVKCLEDNIQFGATVVKTDKIIESEKDSRIYTIKVTSWMPDIKNISLYRQCIDNQLTPIATLFRREAYEKVGRFDDTLPVVGDWEFGLRLLMQYDVGFIDRDYALANYHHRAFTPGSSGNTSFAGNNKHQYYTNLIMNQYLRKELTEGRLGVGYIMNNLRYEQSFISKLLSRFLPRSIISFMKRRAGN